MKYTELGRHQGTTKSYINNLVYQEQNCLALNMG